MDSLLVLGRVAAPGPLPGEESAEPERQVAKSGTLQTSPSACVPLWHQVAGHKHGIDKVGILQHPDGTILKQLQPPPRGPCELHFYTQVFDPACSDSHLLALRQHLPRFYGTWASPESPADLYLKLEDVTRKFSRPCILDVKVGRRSYDPCASVEKREKQIRKFPLMEEIGFLLLGMRVYQVTFGGYKTQSELFGRSLCQDTLSEGLSQFFHDGERIRKDAVSMCLWKVREVLHWFQAQEQLHFYASSLLLVYEGEPRRAHATPSANATPNATPNVVRREEPEPEPNGHQPAGARTRSPPYTPSPARSTWAGHAHHARHAPASHQQSAHPSMDGPSAAEEEEEEEEEERNRGMCRQTEQRDGERDEGVEVRMIDFTHVYPSHSPDESYMHGLQNLLATLERILLL